MVNLAATVGRSDGSYFLNVSNSVITDGSGQKLDAAGNGTFGINPVFEAWPESGDTIGVQTVPEMNTPGVQATPTVGSGVTGSQYWYMDDAIDSTDISQLNNRLDTHETP